MNELELKVLQVINDVTEQVYIGKLKVIIDDDIYLLKLMMNQNESPMCICYQGTESEFLKYLEKDLKSRQIERTHRYKLVKSDDTSNEFITIN